LLLPNLDTTIELSVGLFTAPIETAGGIFTMK